MILGFMGLRVGDPMSGLLGWGSTPLIFTGGDRGSQGLLPGTGEMLKGDSLPYG